MPRHRLYATDAEAQAARIAGRRKYRDAEEARRARLEQTRQWRLTHRTYESTRRARLTGDASPTPRETHARQAADRARVTHVAWHTHCPGTVAFALLYPR